MTVSISTNLSAWIHFLFLINLSAHGFAGAAWLYPERYLDREFRDGTSAFRQLDPSLCEKGLSALADDLRIGSWDSRYGDIRSRNEYDHGYTFLTIKSEQDVDPNA